MLIAGEDVIERAELIGHASAAEAEYRAILLGLAMAVEAGVPDLEVRCDSLLAIRAIEGGAVVAQPVIDAARPLRERALALAPAGRERGRRRARARPAVA